jgi:hypothetical protein
MGIVSTLKGFYESNLGQGIITMFTVGSAIFSLVTAITALTSFQAGRELFRYLF